MGSELASDAKIVRAYVLSRQRTAEGFDLRAGTWVSVSSELIRSTRIFSSRISKVEEEWFVDRGQTAPWSRLKKEGSLLDADPALVDGLYDRGREVWNHFSTDRPSGIATAKISKVLHAMYPHFFPVLDSRVLRLFRTEARNVANELQSVRSGRYLYWAAIRRDLLEKKTHLDDLRERLKSDGSESVRTWAAHVSDVRLHDVLAWSDD